MGETAAHYPREAWVLGQSGGQNARTRVASNDHDPPRLRCHRGSFKSKTRQSWATGCRRKIAIHCQGRYRGEPQRLICFLLIPSCRRSEAGMRRKRISDPLLELIELIELPNLTYYYRLRIRLGIASRTSNGCDFTACGWAKFRRSARSICILMTTHLLHTSAMHAAVVCGYVSRTDRDPSHPQLCTSRTARVRVKEPEVTRHVHPLEIKSSLP